MYSHGQLYGWEHAEPDGNSHVDVVQHGSGYGKRGDGDRGGQRDGDDHGGVWVDQRKGYADGDPGFEFDQRIPEYSQRRAGRHTSVHGHGALQRWEQPEPNEQCELEFVQHRVCDDQ